MAVVKPFYGVRPNPDTAAKVAALPYDVYSRQEAMEAVKGNTYSFLNIDRPETQFPADFNMYDDSVYNKAKELLDGWIQDGTFIQDQRPCYYLYELTMDGRAQTGLVACSAIADYENQIIKKHENTRAEKEMDRIRHVDTTNAQTGPIFLAYRARKELDQIVAEEKQQAPIYDFISEDGISHRVWKVDDRQMVQRIEEIFETVPFTYIADGHHRAASAVKVGQKRRSANAAHRGTEEYNYFLSVLFPDQQLLIMPYNRVVKDLNGMSKAEYLERVAESFEIEALGTKAFQPEQPKTFGMYLDGCWYCLRFKKVFEVQDAVTQLDVSILQDYLLKPVLNIGDPRTDSRIDFIGGIRGLSELEKRVNSDMKVAFSLCSTSMEQLFQVADANLLMPPKSTWFEPKLRSGLFIHKLDEVQD